jgi:hypothetical protein
MGIEPTINAAGNDDWGNGAVWYGYGRWEAPGSLVQSQDRNTWVATT